MTQQASDDRQTQSTTRAEACVGVPEVVQAHALQTSTSDDSVPGPLQITARLFRMVAGNHARSEPLQPIQDRKGRGIEDNGFPTTLTVR